MFQPSHSHSHTFTVNVLLQPTLIHSKFTAAVSSLSVHSHSHSLHLFSSRPLTPVCSPLRVSSFSIYRSFFYFRFQLDPNHFISFDMCFLHLYRSFVPYLYIGARLVIRYLDICLVNHVNKSVNKSVPSHSGMFSSPSIYWYNPTCVGLLSDIPVNKSVINSSVNKSTTEFLYRSIHHWWIYIT